MNETVTRKHLTQKWDAISDEEASTLKAELADEDIAIAEAASTDYLFILQHEDKA